ncbi:hypothetical protein BIW11_13414 [Tropilaelaps mercedesae]|uniref:Neurensin-1-like n=1 Tax=Tropilaelaps mercedesae TaxID=418985 RepID=A0A1V9X2J6_9ACAR|nr:hypothetical protein BIW11_13414 [Tropilaelaps mercedesae]
MSAEEERLLGGAALENGHDRQNNLRSQKRRKSNKRSRHRKKGFGVRDNLEHFYNEEVDEWSADGVILENQTVLRRRLFRIPAWKGIAYAGAVLMALAVVFLAVGHGIPKQNPILGDKDGMELIRTSALTFNRLLRTCQIVGLALFCSGGLFVAGGLLIGAFCASEELAGSRHSLVESFVVSVQPEAPRVPQERKVPATENVAPVQPPAAPITLPNHSTQG